MMQPIDLTFFIALFGSLIAGLWDLKTTEIPEEIPALMTGFGLFIWFIYALSIGNMYPLFLSVIVGTMFLSIGWVFYRMGQWGDGDAAIMASIGYLVPFFPSIPLFSFSFFVNIFIVGL
ncbi:MAG: prepilin peptidase, partial [Candidatus Aenigmarchaeota archaeon]|nr:prepilin peptidase [Candidatus Aenigmarchaeota archaeon]